MEAFYNEFKAKYDETVEYVGSVETVIKLFSDRASAIDNMLKSCASAMDVLTDPDKVLFIVFYVFFGLNTGVDGAIELRQTIADEIIAAFNEIGLASSDEFKEYVKTVSDILLSITASADEVIGNDPEGDSITSFFRKIFDFLRKLINKLLAIFKL